MRKLLGIVAVLALAGSADAQGPVRSWFKSKFSPMDAPAKTCVGPNCAAACSAAVVSMPAPMTAEVPAVHRTALFYDLVRLHEQRECVKKGMSHADAHAAAQALTDSVIDGAMKQVKVPLGAFGDGSIIKAIEDFIASPAGQQLIAVLLQLLMHAEPSPASTEAFIFLIQLLTF